MSSRRNTISAAIQLTNKATEIIAGFYRFGIHSYNQVLGIRIILKSAECRATNRSSHGNKGTLMQKASVKTKSRMLLI